ncbi:sigma-70 family RNA polymerase sigma factor [Luteolibacter marinus]|uniref:sigma-70 family RNA polymerase sigma factor n=1 Tax=Luteolibacter marinus TaxID=2776705 RepID=UPI001866B5A9|nr:sigma-70 family RNA polymerase sigma factor [Luteolibacter marinus]
MPQHDPSGGDPSTDFIREITAAQSAITAYIRSLLPGYADYMDILQEVNITLWQKRSQFTAGTRFKAWAFKVTRFHVMNARRRLAAEQHRRVFTDKLMEILADEAPYESELFTTKLSLLHGCLGELREKDRQLLQVRYGGRMTIETYAERHQRNPGTVRATLRRLRDLLLQCVLRKLSQPHPPAQGEFT